MPWNTCTDPPVNFNSLLLPFIALMIAGWLIWDSYQDRGNTVTIDFMSADGIVPGRTPVRYQGVEVGTVQDISLSDDH